MHATETMRADARKNYEELVRVAREHLDSKGVSASLEAIAREAGVGVGTLYRHFPNRDSLIVAALNARGEQLRGASHRIRSTIAAGDRLERWLPEVERYLASYQGLPDSVAHALDCDSNSSPLTITCQEIIDITDEFCVDAQRRGDVRAGVTGRGLFATALMTAWIGSQMPSYRDELDEVQQIVRTGYREREERADRPGS